MAFNKLSQPKPSGTAKYKFDTLPLDKAPVLEVRYAGKGNPGYRSAELKQVNVLLQQGGVGKLNDAKLDAQSQQMAELFAQHVIVGWTDVFEDDGSIAAATPAKFLEFLQQLLAGNFEDEFRNFVTFCRDAGNFRDAPAGAGVELGKG